MFRRFEIHLFYLHDQTRDRAQYQICVIEDKAAVVVVVVAPYHSVSRNPIRFKDLTYTVEKTL